jgi:hypothetical protein
MKRRFNWQVWIGFAIALFAAFSYLPLFINYTITRDFPWVNLLLFGVAGCFLGVGLYRAFARPQEYRGKVSGTILGTLSLAICALFCFGLFYVARSLPSGITALKVGQTAADFALPDTGGSPVKLSDLLRTKRAVLLIFYRGYW